VKTAKYLQIFDFDFIEDEGEASADGNVGGTQAKIIRMVQQTGR